MLKKKVCRQLWTYPYKRLLIELAIILMISSIVQDDPHHIIPAIVYMLGRLS